MVPRQIGLTRAAAVGARRRYCASGDWAGGAIGNAVLMMLGNEDCAGVESEFGMLLRDCEKGRVTNWRTRSEEMLVIDLVMPNAASLGALLPFRVRGKVRQPRLPAVRKARAITDSLANN